MIDRFDFIHLNDEAFFSTASEIKKTEDECSCCGEIVSIDEFDDYGRCEVCVMDYGEIVE